MPDTSDNLRSEYNERYEEAFRSWDSYLHEARRDLDFAVGDSWSHEEKEYLRRNRREALTWNKTKRIIKLVTGYQRKNRLGFRVQAEEGADDSTASQLSQLLLFCMDRCNGYHVMSDAFESGPLKTGINLVEIGVNFSEDPVSGDIKLFRVPYNRFLLDPNTFRRDLSDCGYILRREWVTKKEAQTLIPQRAKEIADLRPSQTDNKFTFALKSQGADERLRWDEYWRRDTEKRTILVDPQTGEWKFWPKNGGKDRLEFFLQQFPQIITRDIYQPTVKLAVFLEDEMFYNDSDPLGIDDYPFVPLWGEWNPEHDEYKHKLASMVRDIRDPQRELNKRRSKMLDIIDSQVNSGWMAEEGSVVNPKDMYQAGQGKVIWFTKGSLQNARARPIDPPNIPAGMFQFQELMDRDIMEIPGANNELLGIPDRDQTQTPGLLAKLRQSQGLTTLQDIFDNYRHSKSLLGHKLLKVIQQTYTPDKVQKILGEQPSQEFFSRKFGKYRVNVAEGVLTDSQRQMYYSELVLLKQMGAPIPWSAIIDAAPVQRKDDLQKIVQQEEQAAAQEMQRQRQLEEIQIKASLAKTREDVASAVEKTAQAQENRAGAVLDRVKAVAEIDKLGADRFKVLADALEVLSRRQQQVQQPGPGPQRQRLITRR